MEAGDGTGLPDDIVGLQPVSAVEAFAGEGGSFGGGGASGSFGKAVAEATRAGKGDRMPRPRGL
jgi:hypothetical protein